MDIRLGGPIDGVQAAAEIVRRHKIPVIYITANSHVFLDGSSEMAPPYFVLPSHSQDSLQAAIKHSVIDGRALCGGRFPRETNRESSCPNRE